MIASRPLKPARRTMRVPKGLRLRSGALCSDGIFVLLASIIRMRTGQLWRIGWPENSPVGSAADIPSGQYTASRSCCLLNSRGWRFVDDLAIEDGHFAFHVFEIGCRHSVEITIPHGNVRALAWLDGADFVVEK